MEDLRDFMIEKEWHEKRHNTSCPHMLVAEFHRVPNIDNERIHNGSPFPAIPALAIYLFNFACADFQDPWKLDENPNR